MKQGLNLALLGLLTSVFSITYASELESITVNFQETPLEQTLDGTIEAIKKSTVSSQISGRITEINFDVDNTVNKGDVLLRVRDNEYRARLQQAEAALNEARAQSQDAKLEFDRAKDMYKKNVISEAQYDRADAAVKGAEARVAAGKAAVAEAKEQLQNTEVKAPYSGVVTERHVELGETVNPGKPLMTGISLNQLRTLVEVPQSFINAVRKYKKARVILIENNQVIPGQSLTIFPYADPVRHAFPVRINLPQNTDHIYPGMLVKVAFTTDTTKRLMIPKASLVQRSEVSAVYVIDQEGKVKMRQVRTGYITDKSVEILAGLDAGESIAVNPVEAGIALKNQSGDK